MPEVPCICCGMDPNTGLRLHTVVVGQKLIAYLPLTLDGTKFFQHNFDGKTIQGGFGKAHNPSLHLLLVNILKHRQKSHQRQWQK